MGARHGNEKWESFTSLFTIARPGLFDWRWIVTATSHGSPHFLFPLLFRQPSSVGTGDLSRRRRSDGAIFEVA